MRSLRTLAKHPLAHVGRALHQLNALVFAPDQEPNHRNVHQGDLAQVQDFTCTAVIYCRSDAGDTIRLNAAAQPQPADASIGVFFNSQHRLIVAGYAAT